MASDASLIMFVVYVAVLFLILWRMRISKALIVVMLVMGSLFGIISYMSVMILNTVELCFLDTQGMLHVLLIGPVQEEIGKFVFFSLAFTFAAR